MSLDVYLYPPTRSETSMQRAIACLRQHGFDKEADTLSYQNDPDYAGSAFSANITHNLNDMANEAGIYEACWRPEEIGITHAHQLIEPLTKGLELMKSDRARFEKFNAPNGWGKYENFVPWVERYLEACKSHPDHEVSVSL